MTITVPLDKIIQAQRLSEKLAVQLEKKLEKTQDKGLEKFIDEVNALQGLFN